MFIKTVFIKTAQLLDVQYSLCTILKIMKCDRWWPWCFYPGKIDLKLTEELTLKDNAELYTWKTYFSEHIHFRYNLNSWL